jgi:hypothetical protein
VSPLLRRLIEDDVVRLRTEGCEEEYSRVIARRHHISEELVDRIMGGLIIEHRAEAATLRCGVAGTLDEAKRAARAAWEGA